MTNERIKTVILDILDCFDAFCREHDIRYYIGYGTMLGAVRHKGFIPWDDDLDVILMRDQYEKFKAAVAEDRFLDKEKHFRVRMPGDENYAYSFTKIDDIRYTVREQNVADRYCNGLFIDVFFMDNWPESPLRERWQLKQLRRLLAFAKLGLRGNLQDERSQKLDKLLKPVDAVLKIFGYRPEKVLRYIENYGLRNPPGRYVGNLGSACGRASERFDKTHFDGTSELEFEGRVFPGPLDVDGYLHGLYGDYMALPPEDKRVGHGYDVIREPQEDRA